MAYATTTQLATRLGSPLYARLTDRVNGGIADAAVAQEIVTEAEAVVNAALAQRYRTPVDLTANPELAAILASRTLDIAEFLAWKSSPFTSDIAERVRTAFDDASAWLQAVARGEVPLPAATVPAATPASADGPFVSSAPRQFTRNELDGL